MKAGRLKQQRPSAPATEAVILFQVGGYRMAIGAGAVQKIRKDRGLRPAEIGCSTIVSAHALFGIAAGPGGRLLVLHRGGVAVRVDKVERMIETSELRPLPHAFLGPEREWYRGLALAEGIVLPLVDPEAFERQAKSEEEENFAEFWASSNLFSEKAIA